MTETGERYTTARAGLQAPKPPDIREARSLLQRIPDPVDRDSVWKRLKALSPVLLRRVTVEGLANEDWRIRRGSARLLDDLALTGKSQHALARALRDPHPKVRMAAFHTLVCEGCKPDACALDVRALVVEMLADPDGDVRRRVLLALWDPRLRAAPGVMLAAIRQSAAHDPSGRVRDEASRFLDGVDVMRKLRARWDALPPDVRERTTRHAGKWVAVVDGKVISADHHIGQVRRDVRGKPSQDAAIYFVPEC